MLLADPGSTKLEHGNALLTTSRGDLMTRSDETSMRRRRARSRILSERGLGLVLVAQASLKSAERLSQRANLYARTWKSTSAGKVF
jgi:hypothetical protein